MSRSSSWARALERAHRACWYIVVAILVVNGPLLIVAIISLAGLRELGVVVRPDVKAYGASWFLICGAAESVVLCACFALSTGQAVCKVKAGRMRKGVAFAISVLCLMGGYIGFKVVQQCLNALLGQ